MAYTKLRIGLLSAVATALGLSGPAGAAPTTGNSGFESPQIAGGTFIEHPTGFGWDFFGVTHSDSGVANGSGSWGSGAATGTQYAYLQRTSRIQQLVGGFDIGKYYQVQFNYARRNGGVGGNDANTVEVSVGNKVVTGGLTPIDQVWRPYKSPAFLAEANSLMLQFRGLVSDMDRTTLLDDVSFVETTAPPPETVVNGSFELPGYGSRGWAYDPQVADVGWTFLGHITSNQGSGIASVGSPWGNSAVDGNQFAFLQRNGFISQSINNLVAGRQYQVKFKLGSRPGFQQHFVRVMMGGSQILGPVSNMTGWADERTALFTATGNPMELRIEGIDGQVDAASLIDSVEIVPEPSTMVALGLGAIALLRKRKKKGG